MRRVWAVAGVVLALASCGRAAPEQPPPRTGTAVVTVTGKLTATGGPSGAAATGLAGSVVFSADDGTDTRATAGTDGTFRVDLRPGRYTVTGTSPDFGGSGSCQADGPITVPTGGLGGVQVLCQRK